jgi:hypothetical protein
MKTYRIRLCFQSDGHKVITRASAEVETKATRDARYTAERQIRSSGGRVAKGVYS